MKTLIRIALLFLACHLVLGQTKLPANNPNGVWQAQTGTKFRLQLTGQNLTVKLEGSNPTYLQYEVTLERTNNDDNWYKGKGFFRAKLKSGKECRFDTEWEITVIQTDTIVGNVPRIVPEPDSCTVKEKLADRMDLKKI